MSTGEQTASIGYEARMSADSGRIRLYYTTTTYGERMRVGLLDHTGDDASTVRGAALVVSMPENR